MISGDPGRESNLTAKENNPVLIKEKVDCSFFFNLFLAVLGLCCCSGFSAVAELGLLLVVASRGHGLSSCGSQVLEHRLSSCDSWA